MLIKCYNPEKLPPQNCFYILNKGNNSGRPMEKPCPNCFIVYFAPEDTELKEFYYYLVYGMWQAKAFYPHLIGSVIPFIRIGTVKHLIRVNENTVLSKLDNFRKLIAAINRIKIQKEEIQKIFAYKEQLAQRGLASMLHPIVR